MKTKSGKDFSISGSEWKNGTLIVYYWIEGTFQSYKFMDYSRKEAYSILRDEARRGLLD